MKPITFTLSLKAVNSQNSRKHFMAKARDTKKERDRASLGLRTADGFLEIRPLLRVTLTRVGPRQLDSDNLAGALKGVRDGIASRLRIDDGSPLIEWKYEQERGEYAVRVRVEEIATGLNAEFEARMRKFFPEPFDASDHERPVCKGGER